MAIINGYCTLAELKLRINDTSSAKDAALESAINTASRTIDQWCSTRFFARGSETRYFTARDPYVLFVDDICNAQNVDYGLVIKTDGNADGTYEDTWATTDYITEPLRPNYLFTAVDTGNDDEVTTPILKICVNKNAGNYAFPTNIQKGVEITTYFGYCVEAPQQVKEACLLLAQRMYLRSATPYGIAGSTGLGQTVMAKSSYKDDDIMAMLSPFLGKLYVA